VKTSADLRTAVSLMFTHDVAWLACVDADGRHAGVVTHAGITRILGETYRRAAPPSYAGVEPALEAHA
jgi:osmoprotectant transport system ATP-binding protein